MRVQDSVIADLQTAIEEGSKEKRVETLRRVTDLFLGVADRCNETQISVFDDVLYHLIKRIETKALEELGTRLAPINNAPIEVIRRLARNDDIVVAAPVLSQSARLTAEDLIEITQTMSQAHLLAISGRTKIDESVTDELLTYGDHAVAEKLARNTGAKFSESGFTTLVKRAETDDGLARRIGLRLDIPLQLLRELLLRATETVRAWLLEHAPQEAQNEIQRVISEISNEVIRESTTPRDFTQAQQLIAVIKAQGKLDEATLSEFVNARKYEEIVVTLAELSSATIQTIVAVMKSDRNDEILVPCKAAGLKWPTVCMILKTRFAHHSVSDSELAQAKTDYLTLSQVSAQRTLRFWLIHRII